MQAAREARSLVLHSCCISYRSEIQSNRALAFSRGSKRASGALRDANLTERRFLRCHALSHWFRGVPETNGTDFWYRSAVLEGFADRKSLILNWLPPGIRTPIC